MQHLILLTILLLVVGLFFIVTRWRGGLHMTFSQHAAASSGSKIFYSFLFLATLPLVLWFFIAWFVPAKGLPAVYLWFAWAAVIFQILCTWIPEDGGARTVAHRFLTGISGIAILPLVMIIALSSNVSLFARFIAWISMCVMIILLGIALKNQRGYRWALLLQTGYYGAFFLVILATTYY